MGEDQAQEAGRGRRSSPRAGASSSRRSRSRRRAGGGDLDNNAGCAPRSTAPAPTTCRSTPIQRAIKKGTGELEGCDARGAGLRGLRVPAARRW
ncbi:MAG: hypothetical protein MZV70_00305 [Desulfobacterales bacterium]|nr:hypothetical protein [Desulfobacterales bacterium]